MREPLYTYFNNLQDNDSVQISRFNLYVEEELDVLQKYIHTDVTPLCLKIPQTNGRYLYALPNVLLEVGFQGEVSEIFNTQRQTKEQIVKLLRCFKSTPLFALYRYVLEITP